MTVEQFDALAVDVVRDSTGRAMRVVFRTKFGIGCVYGDDNYVHTFARYAGAWKELGVI